MASLLVFFQQIRTVTFKNIHNGSYVHAFTDKITWDLKTLRYHIKIPKGFNGFVARAKVKHDFESVILAAIFFGRG